MERLNGNMYFRSCIKSSRNKGNLKFLANKASLENPLFGRKPIACTYATNITNSLCMKQMCGIYVVN